MVTEITSLERIRQGLKFIGLGQVHTQYFPSRGLQRFVIAQRLRAQQRPEAQPLRGNFHVVLRVSNELNEPALVRSALVKLSRGMLEARTESRRRRAVSLFANRHAQTLQRLNRFRVARQVGIDRHEISIFRAR